MIYFTTSMNTATRTSWRFNADSLCPLSSMFSNHTRSLYAAFFTHGLMEILKFRRCMSVWV